MKAGLARALDTAAVIAWVIVATFLLLQWLPGDPAELYAGEGATGEEVALLRERLGLDQPLAVQLLRHAGRLLRGDLGVSLRSGRPVRDEIAARLPVTLRLAAAAAAVGAAVALGGGVAAGADPSGRLARVLDWVNLSILALPVYWLGMIMILVFTVRLGWPALGGTGRWGELFLPALALGAHTGAATARILAASLSDALGAAYLRTALGKGASGSRALLRHALPNALIPAVTYFFMEGGRLLGGAVLTETVFALNGIGRYLVTSIAFRDYPAVVGVTCFIAACVTLSNAAADLLCRCLDPRARRGKG